MIDQALDAQSHRIGSMMFVRTLVTDDKGEALREKDDGHLIVEDDGC